MLPGRDSGRMRARGVFYRNRDGTTYARQQKKGRLCKDSTEIPCDLVFHIYIPHTHNYLFFLSIQTQAHFHFHLYTLGRLNCINAIDYLKAEHIQQLYPPLGACVHLCTQVLHKGTHSQPLGRRRFLSTVPCPFCPVTKQMLVTAIGIIISKTKELFKPTECNFSFISKCYSACKFFSAR